MVAAANAPPPSEPAAAPTNAPPASAPPPSAPPPTAPPTAPPASDEMMVIDDEPEQMRIVHNYQRQDRCARAPKALHFGVGCARR